MIEQKTLLDRVAGLVDEGRIRTTANFDAGTFTVDNLKKAHARQENGSAIGKTTLTL